MYAKLHIVGKHSFASKAGKTIHVIYGAILESESVYDQIEEGYKCVTAFVTSDVYKDINRKDVIAGNLSYNKETQSASFWPYGMRKQAADDAGREET